jgi:hypothetical protein
VVVLVAAAVPVVPGRLVLPQQHLELAPHIQVVEAAGRIVTLEHPPVVLERLAEVTAHSQEPTVVLPDRRRLGTQQQQIGDQVAAAAQFPASNTIVAAAAEPVEQDSSKSLIGPRRR